jgi:hypothetical protein
MSATNPSALSLSDLNVTINHEPRIRDLRIAERLGMTDPYSVRRIIDRNRAELETYGSLAVRHRKSSREWVSDAASETSENGGRPGTEFWLNEPQTLLICMFSKTANAAAVRREVISVYMAYRRGEAAHVLPDPAPERVSAPPCSWLAQNDGRYVIVVENHAVAEVRNIAGYCMVNGRDAVNVCTFLQEFVSADIFPVVWKVILQRCCVQARIQPGRKGKGVTNCGRISPSIVQPFRTKRLFAFFSG